MQQYKNIDNQDDDSLLDNLDFIKFLLVAQKNLIWVILIFVLSFSAGFLYLRYTKSIFESSSIIKIEKKDEANIGFKLTAVEDNDTKILSSEIEILKSRTFFEKLAKKLHFELSVFAYGNINYMERYKISPFKIDYALLDNNFYDQNFDIEVVSNKTFFLYPTFQPNLKKEYRFGEKISTPSYTFTISLVDPNKILLDNKFFFTINSEKKQVADLMAAMDVSVLNIEAKTIKISYKSFDPIKARDVVSAIDSLYLIESLTKKFQVQEQSIQFLRNQLDDTEKKLQEFEIKLESFSRNNRTFNVLSDFEKNSLKSEEFEKSVAEIKEEINLLDDLKNLIAQDSDIKSHLTAFAGINNTQLAAQIVQLSKAQADLQVILNTSKENTFAYNTKRIELESVKSNILSTIIYSKKNLNDRLFKYNSKVQETEQKFDYLPSKETELTRLKRLYTVYEKFYLTLIEKESEFGIAKAGMVPEFSILSEPQVPVVSIYPVKLSVYLTVFGIALLISFVLVVVKYFLHNTINNQGELEKSTIAPVLGVVPKYKKEKMDVSRLVVDKNPKSPLSEALRSIRTNIEFMVPNQKTKRIMSVTSTISGEGKTFVALNLSGVIAMSGLKVVVIDLDMRKPKIHRAFDKDNDLGMSTILIGKSTVEQCIHKTSIDNLDFISAGPTPPNPSELILREEFEQTLQYLHTKYDIIFIDTPPVGLVTDGIIIMKKVDQPIYVVRAEYSKKGFEKNINKLVTQNNFRNLGVILNGFDNSMSYGYGYKYGYGYGYGYGSGYYNEEAKMPFYKRILAFFRLI
jgi:tyrosine-protein kinase Etk/Wzc